MEVLLINGSPHARGCTYTALREAANTLSAHGVEAEILHLGTEPISGCIGCGACRKTGSGKCMFKDDIVNVAIEKAAGADGFIFGTPVHYAAASGALTSFMDRAFYAGGNQFAYKPAAAVASCRRGGASATLDQINKYFGINNMPVVPSNYWNMVHGNTPEEVVKDEEGMQTMRVLAENMAWMLEGLSKVKKPDAVPKIKTNFIR